MKFAIITYPWSFAGPPFPPKVKYDTKKPLTSYFDYL